MKMCKRAALCAVGKIKVESVSTAAHTAAGVPALTWEALSKYSKAVSRDTGHAYSNATRSVTFTDGLTLGVGDYLNITIDGETYQVDLLGFRHDLVTDPAAYGGAYAGITWQLHHCYATEYAMNPSSSNVGGWTSCEMRTVRMPAFWDGLSGDLRAAIVWVDKLASAGNKSAAISTSSDNLFLLSEYEVFASTNQSFPGEGEQYAYWAAATNRKKTLPGGGIRAWWERSPENTATSYWACVRTDGLSGDDTAKTVHGVAFAFCT